MKRNWNWPLWAGFLFSIVAFVSFFVFFVKFPVTRDFPWANLLLFGLAALLLIVGLRRAFVQRDLYRGKIFGPILTALSVAIFAMFFYGMFIEARHMPSGRAAPQVGQKAPEFTLADSKNTNVSLSELLSSPLPGAPAGAGPKGVLLVFYRGYW